MADVELVIKIPEEIRTSLRWGVISDESINTVCDAIRNGTPLPKGLEVLDKIRAEIVDLGQRTMNDNRASGIWACRDIIDKYKAESEDPHDISCNRYKNRQRADKPCDR